MGSAVVKPLTRRRGKIKKNQVDLDPETGNEKENATSNCEPDVNCKVNTFSDSADNSRQQFLDKPCKVKADNKKSKTKVCCTYDFFSGRQTSYDSDEELCQKHQDCKKELGPLQIINSLNNGTHLSDNASTILFTSQKQSPTDPIVLSQDKPQLDRFIIRNQVPTAVNSLLISNVCSPLMSVDIKENSENVLPVASFDNKPAFQVSKSTKDIDRTNADVDKIHIPPYVNDTINDAKRINLESWLREQSTSLSHLKKFSASPETKVSIETNPTAAITKVEEHLVDNEDANYKISSCNEYVMNEHGGAGEPAFKQLSCEKNGYLSKSIKIANLCEDLNGQKDDNSKGDNRCPPLREMSSRPASGKSIRSANILAKAQETMSLECNENNAVRLTDSFVDYFKAPLTHSDSNRCSNTSLNEKVSYTGQRGNCLFLNSPHIEDVLAVGEEFLDEINKRYFPQCNTNSPSPNLEHQIESILENEDNETVSVISSKKKNDMGDRVTLGSSRRSSTSSRSSGCSCDPQCTRCECVIEPPDVPGCTRLVRSNTYQNKSCSRQSSATKNSKSSNSNEVAPSKTLSNAGQIIEYKESEFQPFSVQEAVLMNNVKTTIACSSKESLQSKRILHVQSISNLEAHNESMKTSSPCLATDVTFVNVVSNICSSRPPSSKRSLLSEQNHARQRIIPSQQQTSISDSMNLNTKPPSVRSRQSLIASRPQSEIPVCSQQSQNSSRSHSGIAVCSRQSSNASRPQSSTERQINSYFEVVGERAEQTSTGVGFSLTHTNNSTLCQPVDNRTENYQERPRESDSARCNHSHTSQTSLAMVSKTELKAITPQNTTCLSSRSENHWKIETPVETREVKLTPDTTSLLEGSRKTDHSTTPLPRSSSFSTRSAADEQEDPFLETLIPPGEMDNRNEFIGHFGGGDAIQGASSSLAKTSDEEAATGSATLYDQSSCVSTDLIGNIRKQLYEEGLKPAERDGGVAFFIPVTEDGLLPQIDGAVVAERLTKTKKSSLNYEERMFLANINRQVQLSKKKEFAIRDIRNVKGAASSSDGSDRTKQNDDLDEFDASF